LVHICQSYDETPLHQGAYFFETQCRVEWQWELGPHN